jgi:predicted GTPase
MTFLDSPGLLDFTDELPYIHYIIQNADLLLFVVEDTVGITAKEQHILELIRAEKKQHSTFLIVNKLDVKWKESETDLALAEYYTLGIEKVIGISAKTERNLNEIQEQLFNFFRHWKKEHPTYVQPSEESTTT